METVKAGSALATGLALTELDVQDLWGRYVTIGGTHSRLELALYISDGMAWSPEQHDLAAEAMNGFLSSRGLDHPVSYSRDMESQSEPS